MNSKLLSHINLVNESGHSSILLSGQKKNKEERQTDRQFGIKFSVVRWVRYVHGPAKLCLYQGVLFPWEIKWEVSGF